MENNGNSLKYQKLRHTIIQEISFTYLKCKSLLSVQILYKSMPFLIIETELRKTTSSFFLRDLPALYQIALLRLCFLFVFLIG